MYKELRYTQNHLNNPLPEENMVESVFESLVNELKYFRQNVPVGCLTDKCSNKQKERQDLSMFSGAGGYLYLYLRMYEFVKTLPDDLQSFCTSGLSDQELPEFYNPDTYLDLAQKQFEAMQVALKPDRNITFLMSNIATSLLGADLYFIKKDQQNFSKHISQVLSIFANIMASPNQFQQELLYGIPGYLYIFLWINQRYSKEQGPYQLDLTSHIFNLCKMIILNCGEGIMKCKFYDQTYFGGAHGILGIIQVLLLSYEQAKEYFHLKDEKFTLKMLESIQLTLDYLTKIYNKQGNIPPSAEDLQSTELFQFCHGIPGAIGPYLKAYQIFNKQEYLNTAIHMSETLYIYGMIKKGYGICHGIPGNSYGFMQLYQVTKNEKLKKYAFQFLQYKQNPFVFNEVKNFKFHDRYNVGMSDNPFSLMLGSVGEMCAMMDFINYKRMPGYEV
ncbi:unnamed protein product (macronuclear) [Paramecium tetraurelia]|uniref:Lanthionine synthetase C-like protein n=1 Tax=Paramecium tetraurelia TaxID=5888 RepID=A0C467_PARTE|nr:uncharacterized protein GSPATT00035064001 [Paramecium tetraurelia]CAK65584.1 unnamed protein product [Paramecium tetraurelia]|eukprot:XP_001432981.1 hypothetical protein (macronuclear) [Paramecium tetraurelia strain d4-2]